MCFELASRLKVKFFFKISFGTFRLDLALVERFANYLNCKLLSFPFVYLGLPIEGNPRWEVFWKPILDKFSKKFAK